MIFIYMLYGFMGIMLLFLLIGCAIVIFRNVCMSSSLEVSLPTPREPLQKPVPELITVVIVQPDGQDYALGRGHQVNG